tara:strand:+ start:2526 stop:2948 length:423 start_codon:yes stop_codon:yes gene_type:complete
MDSLSDKIEFKYSKLQSDVDDPTEDWQLLLRVTARFSIWIRGKIFFDEPDFPVVEFAEQAKQWALNGGNFSYVSMETDENPMISFHQAGGDKISISALASAFEVDAPLNAPTVLREIEGFIRCLGEDVKSKLGIDVARIF